MAPPACWADLVKEDYRGEIQVANPVAEADSAGIDAVTGLLATFAGGAAQAQGQMNLYCSVQVEWCQAMATNFQRDTGITVNMTQKGSGETLAQLRAEAQNPRGDVWFGGTGDPHLIVAEEGLSMEYSSPAMDQLHPWALRQYEAANKRSIACKP